MGAGGECSQLTAVSSSKPPSSARRCWAMAQPTLAVKTNSISCLIICLRERWGRGRGGRSRPHPACCLSGLRLLGLCTSYSTSSPSRRSAVCPHSQTSLILSLRCQPALAPLSSTLPPSSKHPSGGGWGGRGCSSIAEMSSPWSHLKLTGNMTECQL